MPHIILEHSPNVSETENINHLFAKIHTALFDVAGIKKNNCKSRIRHAEDVFIDEGDKNNAFVSLDVSFLEGRSDDVKKQLGDALLSILEDWFSESKEKTNIQITVELRDIRLSEYFKYPSGSFTPQ